MLHTCSHEDFCSSCALIDLTIDILRLFDSRPDYFHETLSQAVVAKALMVKLQIEAEKGIIRATAKD